MYYMVIYPYSVSVECYLNYNKSNPIVMPPAELVTLGAEQMTAAATAPTITGNVPLLICLTISCLPYLLLQINTVSSQKCYLSSGKQVCPSRTICNRDKYFDSYNVTIPIQHGQCRLWSIDELMDEFSKQWMRFTKDQLHLGHPERGNYVINCLIEH